MSRSVNTQYLYVNHFFIYIAPAITSDNCTEGHVRLVDGVVKNEGRIEICYEGLWTLICPSSWGRNDAQVTCNQLGYSTVG